MAVQADSNRKSVLVVDDESSVRDSLRLILSRFYEVQVAESGEAALESIASVAKTNVADDSATKAALPDLVLLDVYMPGLDGLGVLQKLQTDFPAIPVIMLTASTAVQTAVKAMKVGAVDYLNKPYDVDELLSLIEETITKGPKGRSAPSVITTSRHSRANLPDLPGDFGKIVGKHPLMDELYRSIEQVAKRDTTVLVTGESGTGKELIAREIHLRSARASGPFVAINCAAIPESLIESELFGHEKGAFTHAVEKREGYFELADGGTLFLDEIGELTLPVQVKLLRFLQDREFYRVGRSKPLTVDVRIVAATNKNLDKAISEGTFRQDLYYRINVVTLEVPPLRERKEDIQLLVKYFIERLSPLYSRSDVSMAAEALTLLRAYDWPGNVRELENVTESVLALAPENIIGVGDLPTRIRKNQGNKTLKDNVLDGNIGFEDAERAFETDIILKALQKTNYVQTRAAEMLGISRRILKYKMDKLGIADHAPSAQSEAPQKNN